MRNDANTHPGFAPEWVEWIFRAVRQQIRAASSPTLIGLSGPLGSGKTTLARQLVAAAMDAGIETRLLSLDDFYFGRAARRRLARDVHPLLAVRGVPGTHDVALLAAVLDALPRARPGSPVFVPRFDKGRDTRAPPASWRRVVRAPRWIVLEGWCVGVPPQPRAALAAPINALERAEDPMGHWRRWVNDRLRHEYARLWRRLDVLIALAAPDLAAISRWREQQEQYLRRRHAVHAMPPSEVVRFMARCERWLRHAATALPAHADLCIDLDRDHRAGRVTPPLASDSSRRGPARNPARHR
ncbi:MAG: kinase [Lysobacterales bacterium]